MTVIAMPQNRGDRITDPAELQDSLQPDDHRFLHPRTAQIIANNEQP